MSQLGVEYARSACIPILLTIHQGPWFAARYLPNITGIRSVSESILWTYARRILQRFTSVIAPSQTISDWVTRMTGIRPTIISNGISLEIFHSHLSSDENAAL